MTYKEKFIQFMAQCGVLTFGDFTAKSGRKTPYFVNTGNYKTGAQLAKLGEFYAACIQEHNLAPETLFGPAYKGIPLSVACSVALYNQYGKEVNYCFNRKETKDHGEGGLLVGKKLCDGEKVVVIEDVITSGAALREVMPIIKSAANVDIIGMVISVDRMERGQGELSAVQEVYRDFGFQVYPIVTMVDIIKAIQDGIIDGAQYLDKMLEYRKIYGVE